MQIYFKQRDELAKLVNGPLRKEYVGIVQSFLRSAPLDKEYMIRVSNSGLVPGSIEVLHKSGNEFVEDFEISKPCMINGNQKGPMISPGRGLIDNTIHDAFLKALGNYNSL